MAPTAKFFLIGDSPLKKEIENLAKDIGACFTGAVDNVADYLNAMDVMLLPSLFGGLPLAALEWQINGLPAILADTVTRECAVSEHVEFFPLQAGAKDWARETAALANAADRSQFFCGAQKRAEEAGYDINSSASLLRRIYAPSSQELDSGLERDFCRARQRTQAG